MATFDGKPEKFELFEDLFQTSLKIHNQLTEENKINCFHSLVRGDSLQNLQKHHHLQQGEFGRNSNCVP